MAGDGPVSVVDLVLGPGPIHNMIETFSAVGWMFLRRMRREVAEAGPDERLQAILERAENYMKDVPDDAEASGSELVVCLHFRIGDKLIKTVVMVARFGTAREVNLDELRVEIAFPRDDEAEAFLRQGAQLSWTRSLPGSGNPCRLADTQPERSPRCTPSCLFAKVP